MGNSHYSRALRYATDPAYRERILAAQARRYAESAEFRQRAIANAKATREKHQRARRAALDAFKQTDEYKNLVTERAALKKIEAIARTREWRDKNPERARENDARTRARKAAGRQAHHHMMHIARQRCCLPPWANAEEIFRHYHAAAVVREHCGIEMHVDHIVPLKHPLVCGLHCEFNLEVVPARYNLKKGQSAMARHAWGR